MVYSFPRTPVFFFSFAVFSQGLKKSSLELYGLICYGELRKKIGGCEYMLFFDAVKLESMESCSLRCRGKTQPFCQMFLIFFPPSTVILHIALQCAFLLALCVGEISKHHLQFALSVQSRRKQKTRQEASVICGCHFTNNEKSVRPCLSRGIKELRRMTAAELKSGIISDYRLGMKTRMHSE